MPPSLMFAGLLLLGLRLAAGLQLTAKNFKWHIEDVESAVILFCEPNDALCMKPLEEIRQLEYLYDAHPNVGVFTINCAEDDDLCYDFDVEPEHYPLVKWGHPDNPGGLKNWDELPFGKGFEEVLNADHPVNYISMSKLMTVLDPEVCDLFHLHLCSKTLREKLNKVNRLSKRKVTMRYKKAIKRKNKVTKSYASRFVKEPKEAMHDSTQRNPGNLRLEGERQRKYNKIMLDDDGLVYAMVYTAKYVSDKDIEEMKDRGAKKTKEKAEKMGKKKMEEGAPSHIHMDEDEEVHFDTAEEFDERKKAQLEKERLQAIEEENRIKKRRGTGEAFRKEAERRKAEGKTIKDQDNADMVGENKKNELVNEFKKKEIKDLFGNFFSEDQDILDSIQSGESDDVKNLIPNQVKKEL